MLYKSCTGRKGSGATFLGDNITTPTPLSTLPPLKPGETWLYNRRLRAWQPAPVVEVESENARLLRFGMSPLTTGAPPAGAKVWGGRGYALYQPETT